MKTTRISILCCLLALAGPVWAQQADVSAPLADELPGGVVFYVGWAGQTDAMAESSLGQILASPEVGQLWELFVQAASASSTAQGPEGKTAVEMIGILLDHEFAIAAVPTDASPGVAVKMVADLGDDADTFLEKMNVLLTSANMGPVEAEAGLWRYDLPDGVPLTIIQTDGRVTCLLGEMPATVDSLARDEAFATALTRVADGQSPQAMVYLDFAQLRETLTAMLPPEAPVAGESDADSFDGSFLNQENINELLSLAGVDEVTTVAMAMRFDGQLMRLTGRIESPGPHTGLLKFYASLPLTDEDLEVIPEDASVVFAINLSLSDMLGEVETVLTGLDQMLDNAQLMAGYEEAMGQFSGMMGFELSTLLDSLGDTWTFSHAASQGGLLTGCVLTVEIEDEAQFAEILAMTEARMKQFGAPLATMGSISYLPTEAGRETVFAPAWMVHEGRLYYAGWPQVLQTVLASDVTPITENEAFQAAMATIPGEPISLTYVDTPELIRLSYGAVLMGGSAMVGDAIRDGMPIDYGFIPSLARLEQLLTPELSAVCMDENGITYEFSGALPTVSLVANLNAPLIGVMAPALVEARKQARIGAMKANLQGIGITVMMYQVDNNDQYPTSLAALVDEGYIDLNALGPIGGPAPRLVNGRLEGYVPHHYIRPAGESGPLAETVMVWTDCPEFEGDAVLVLYVDGHVDTMSRWALMELLEEMEQAE